MNEVFSFEQAAMRGDDMPSGLNGAEQVLFQGLRLLYRNHKAGIVSREKASLEKRDMIDTYHHMKSDIEYAKYIANLYTEIGVRVSNYRLNRTLENADKMVEAIDGVPVKVVGT